MNTENLSTLKIHKLSQEQYDREAEAGRIDENALYLTPDEEITAEQIGAITQDDLNTFKEQVIKDVIAALPVYNGEVL